MPRTLLVIGGGLAGIRLALKEAKSGKRVYVIENCPSLAGERISPGADSDLDRLLSFPELEEVKKNENIEIITNADVEGIEEGNRFRVRIKEKALRVMAERCDDCRDCIRVCPVNLLDEYNARLALRTAIDFSTPKTGVYDIAREVIPICQETCPVHLDIRGYIGLIREGRFEDALALIREKIPFAGVLGRICTQPCEKKCNRGQVDSSISIRGLKRFVSDYERDRGKKIKIPAKAPAREEKIAIVGAGPAGLTCAYDLARTGYQVTVFESLPVAGGMLNVGIPEYRLPKEILEDEIESIKELGVDIKFSTTVGKDLTLDDLFHQGSKAIFVAVGAHQSQRLEIPGRKAEGVTHGVDFLRDLNLQRETKIGKRVAVIGGGNVAMDSARSAIRLGADEVSILYRRTRVEMPASEEEIEAAEKEGIKIQYLAAPAEVLTNNGKVKGIRCIRMELGEPDASGRRRPIPIKGSEFDIELDVVISAIGQKTGLSFLGKESGIEITKQGAIAIDPLTLATTRPGVFAGGDAVTGPYVAIGAMAAGKKAAVSIDKYLRGSSL